MHIGKNGNPFFGGGGSHRLAMAICLEVEFIPIQVGLIHEDFVLNGWREKYKFTQNYLKRKSIS